MKLTHIIAAAVAFVSSAAFAQVSVSIGEPGFYGELNLGGYPPPQVVYAQPTIIQPTPGYVGGPVYLHVPPGYERDWRAHCREYNACGRPVYFVRDDWYRNEYVPRYHAQHVVHEEHRDERRDEHYDEHHDDHGPH